MPTPSRIYLSSPHMGADEFELVREAFATNWIAPLGPHVDAFEKEFSKVIGDPLLVNGANPLKGVSSDGSQAKSPLSDERYPSFASTAANPNNGSPITNNDTTLHSAALHGRPPDAERVESVAS